MLGTGGSRRSHWRGPAAASAKKSEQISELGGSGGMLPGNIFLLVQNAANWAIFSFFVRPLGGAWPPPLEPPRHVDRTISHVRIFRLKMLQLQQFPILSRSD